MSTDRSEASSLQDLRDRLHGELRLPGEPGWDDARAAWQLLADQHPDAVVEAADVHDVIETVRAARALGLGVAPQSTGHAAGALSALGGTILLRTSRLDAVTIDPAVGTARVEAGARWGAVAAAAAEHGLAPVAGMAASVGVAGLLLGGGLGWFARSHGLGGNAVVSFEAVDAQGRMLTVDEHQHPELLWAARGGALPVVLTAVVIRLHPVPELTAGALMWPAERAAEVATAWQDWIAGVPRSVTSVLRMLRFPPIEQIPEPLRGRAFVGVEAAIQEDAETTARLLAPLRALEPEQDTFAPTTAAGLAAVHGDPPEPTPAHGDSLLITEITSEVVEALLTVAAEPVAVPLLSIELRHLGGAASDASVDGAVTSVDGEGLLYMVGMVPVAEALEPVRAAADAVISRLRRFGSARQVKTFADRRTAAAALYGASAQRLRDIRSEWDAGGVIREAHPLS
ncbi:FAD-binding protein [Microbacterium sp. ARD32]|uniref:FAD-binding oxidoreductase n=1 Tax=Microbacterium sp. ARD32 TaxID=2962577 RepID=UPI002880E758|nr:FAD-binding protein [Microbacterium sp. ARD32]MDT0157909.1 FAD-binding protein [Microbacterium sp. ARD32]